MNKQHVETVKTSFESKLNTIRNIDKVNLYWFQMIWVRSLCFCYK